MQSSEIISLVLNLTRDIEKEMYDRLPRKIGVIAKQHFKDNFRKSGFVDGGVAESTTSGRLVYLGAVPHAYLLTQPPDE